MTAANSAHIGIFMGALWVGGRERILLAVAEALAADGACVDILIPGPIAALRAEIHPPVQLIDLHRWWMRLPGIRASNKLRIYLSPPALAAYLRRIHPDVLLAASIPPNLAALIARRLAGTSTRLVLRQSSIVHIPGVEPYKMIRPRPRDRFIRRLYSEADAIIAVSQGVADNLAWIADFPPGVIHTIHNCNVTAEIEAKARQSVNHPWFAPGEPPVLLAVGRMAPKKDYPTLIRAFSRVRAQRETRLLILGREGSERARLLELATRLGVADAVDMLGHVANPFAYMAKASIFVLSSQSEGMPNVLAEALACGCPVVATDCPSGPREILDNGRYGRLVGVGEADAMAKAILDTLESPPKRAFLRARGAEFGVDRAVQGYLKVLWEMAGKKACGRKDNG